MKLSNKQLLWLAGGGLVVGYYLVTRAGEAAAGAAKAVGEGVNPTSRKNIIYQGVNALGDVLVDGQDDDDFSLGDYFYQLIHPEEYRKIHSQMPGGVVQ